MAPSNVSKRVLMSVHRFGLSRIAAVAIAMFVARTASAQAPAGLVSGPLTWAPTIELRDAGVDSNVFNDPENPKEARRAFFSSLVISKLKLPYLRLSTRGAVDYNYFERYTSQRSTNGLVNSRIVVPLSRFQPTAFG